MYYINIADLKNIQAKLTVNNPTTGSRIWGMKSIEYMWRKRRHQRHAMTSMKVQWQGPETSVALRKYVFHMIYMLQAIPFMFRGEQEKGKRKKEGLLMHADTVTVNSCFG